MSTAALIIDTGAVCLVRAGLFYLCRRFLLQTIYSDLRHISDPTVVGTPSAPSSPIRQYVDGSLSRRSSVEEISLLPMPISANGQNGWTWRRPPVDGDDPSAIDLSLGSGAGGGRVRPRGSLLEKVLDTAATQLTHSVLSRSVFGTVFAETCTLFVLVLFQATDILHEPARVMNFRGSLLAASLLILLACPLLELHLLIFGRLPPSKARPTLLRLLAVFVPFLLYVLLLFQIPLPPVPIPTLFDSFLARLILLGVIILSVLSALASLHATHELVLALRPGPLPKPTDITSTEYSLTRLRNDLSERTREQERLAETRGEVGVWGKVFGKGASENRALTAEVGAMRALEEKMSRDLESMRAKRARMEYSKTLKGRLWNAATLLFGIYCAFRIISVISNIVLPLILTRRSTTANKEWNVPDIITYILALAVAHLPFIDRSSVDVQLLGRQISLILVGVVVGGNVRLMMRNVAKALKVTSRNTIASFLLLILTQIMGMYLLSTLVQLRSSVPTSAGSEEPLFALLPRFEMFGRIFDVSFFITCVCWGVWRAGRWLWVEG